MIWEDTRDNIAYGIKSEIENKYFEWNFLKSESIDLEQELQSYPSTSIGMLHQIDCYCGIEVTIVLIPKTVTGYSSGFCLDYELYLEDMHGGTYTLIDEQDTVEGTLDIFICDYLDNFINMGSLIEENKQEIYNTFTKLIVEGTEILEEQFEQYSTPLVQVGQLSNGERIYEKNI